LGDIPEEYEAQMEYQEFEVKEQEVLEENNDKEIVMQQITDFVESKPSHPVPVMHEVAYTNNTMPIVDLDRFLLRPIFISNTSWASTSAIGTTLGSWAFPTIYTNNATIRSKLEKIAFWKPTFEISIRMNGTPMHYGKLVFAWIPQASALNTAFTSSYFSMFSNNWIQVSPSANQTTTIVVPYVHYKDMISVGALKVDLFTLYCFVAVPLNSVNGAPPPVNFTIYTRVLENNLAGYNDVSDWSAQMERSSQGTIKPKVRRRIQADDEAAKKTDNQRVVSRTLNVISDFASQFSVVPAVGALATPISVLFKGASGIAHWLGFDIPINEQLTHPMQIRQPRILAAEDCITALTLGPYPSQSAAKDYAFVNDTIDASSLLHFAQRPALFRTSIITSAASAGDLIFSDYVHPNAHVCSDYTGATPTNSYVVTPMSYITDLFRYWRGGIRYHLTFICSHFHSFRVRIWYKPFMSNITLGTTIPIVTETGENDLISVVLDINKETDYSFTIPYMQTTEFLKVRRNLLATGSDDAMLYYNGMWGVTLINPLTSGAATVSPVYMQVFESAASDFQWSCPQISNALGWYSPQSEEVNYEAQSEFQLTPCEIPSSSMACLMEKDYPPLGNCAHGRKTTNVYMTSELHSIKQLTNLLCPIMSVPTSVGNEEVVFSFVNYSFTNPYSAAGLNTANSNYTMRLYNVFRYWRGGYRLSARTLDTGATAQAPLNFQDGLPGVQAFTGAAAPAGTLDLNSFTTNTPGYTTAQAQWSKMENSPVDFVVPYNNVYRCYPTVANNVYPSLDFMTGNIAQIYVTSTSTNTSPVSFFLSGADDYIFGFQIGIPLQTITAPPS